MKKRLLYLVIVYFGFLALFALEKPLFMMLQNSELLAETSSGDWMRVMWHGLKLDISVAGYLMLFVWATMFVSVWTRGQKWALVVNRIYFIIISLVLSVVFMGNALLYPYWGFPLDSTPLFYLQSPADALASVSGWFIAVGVFFAILIWMAVAWGFFLCTRLIIGLKPALNRIWWSIVMVLAGGLLFLAIRGGTAQSTANVGRVYFSHNIFLNHSAVNPLFSLMESLTRQGDIASRYRFFPEAERAAVFDSLKAPAPDSLPKVLTTDRPDVLLVLLESFSMNILDERVDGIEITPRINALRSQGIWFPQFYASSFRTDRGLVSILNGYPAQPMTSIMKYPAKSQTLPSIARKLRGEGYSTEMIYGGDIDFTNMRSYFYSSGFSTVTGKDGLRLGGMRSKWGYDDRVMFGETLRRIGEKPAGERFFMTFLTLSSHEPFAVPFDRFDDPILNAMAFTDDCLGEFIDSLRRMPVWDNLLVILVPDHALTFPRTLPNYDISRHHIPMVWTGGAVTEPVIVGGMWSQSDIAATLLGQLGLDDGEFIFSRNIFNPQQEPMAFYTFNHGFGFLDMSGATVWDIESGRALINEGDEGSALREKRGKAILQTLMEDMAGRGSDTKQKK